MQKPLISIALCTYDGMRHLPEQLRSLLAQDWQPLEIIAVDDGSQDGTWEYLQEQARLDSRLRAYRNEENLGFSRNFERALSLCRGEYIAPSDQDDIWHPQKLSRLAAAMGDHWLVYSDSKLVNSNGESLGSRISDWVNMYQGREPTVFVFCNCVSGHALLARRCLMEAALPMPALKFHDWWLAFVAASLGSIGYVDAPLVQYRQHPHSQTDITGERLTESKADRVKVYREKTEWLRSLTQLPSPHQAYFVNLYRQWLDRGEQWLAISFAWHVARRAPTFCYIQKNKRYISLVLKHLWGMRLKSFLDGKRYPSEALVKIHKSEAI